MLAARLISVIILGRDACAKPCQHGSLFGESSSHYFVRFAFLLNNMGLSLEPGMEECCAVLTARLVRLLPPENLVDTLSQSGALPTLMAIVSRLRESLSETTPVERKKQDTNTIVHALFAVCSVSADPNCQEQVSSSGGFETLISLSSSECRKVKDLAYDILFQLKDHPSNVTRAYKAALTGT
jgi:hypothetical protein